MVGMTINSKKNTNQSKINKPDDLKGIELQIIILPVIESKNELIKFLAKDELEKPATVHLGKPLNDFEDYSKW